MQGTICNKCSNDFIKKASRYFMHLQRRGFKEKHFVDKIQGALRNCHENYMKLYESMIAKRGY